jgi:hypothetical protein
LPEITITVSPDLMCSLGFFVFVSIVGCGRSPA